MRVPHARGDEPEPIMIISEQVKCSPRPRGGYDLAAAQDFDHHVFPTPAGGLFVGSVKRGCSTRVPHARGGAIAGQLDWS